MSKVILITGGCGFVGSNLAIFFKSKYPTYIIIVLDNLKRSGSELNIRRLKNANIKFIHGDIRNKEDFDQLGKIDLLIEASAEPSVLAGINSSLDYLINTNLNGTINCLNFAHKNSADFIFLSTSRVYPIKQLNNINFLELPSRFIPSIEQEIPGVSQNGIAENFPLEGSRSFYGSTKLASELLIEEYHELLGLNTVVNRCGVITGPYQMGKIDQGVIVLWVARHFFRKKLSYIGYGGEGKQLRDVLHIYDLFRLIDLQVHDLKKYNGQTFNVGGGIDCCLSLQELTNICQKVTGNFITIEKDIETRVADIRMYLTDNSKITAFSGWRPHKNIEEIINEIHSWIRDNESELYSILN
jgi:CDP-paratose 2-epimerase